MEYWGKDGETIKQWRERVVCGGCRWIVVKKNMHDRIKRKNCVKRKERKRRKGRKEKRKRRKKGRKEKERASY